MFTLFHVLYLAGLLLGAIFGARAGWALFGPAGGVVGAVVGAAVGVVAGRIPELLAMRSLARDLTGKSSSELRAYLRSPSCLTPNCVLLALRGRGENIHCEIPVVLDLLVSENVGRRGQGWAALTSAFPELVGKIPDYRIGDSVEECRQKTEILRHAVR
jgi:hypothetical protein